MAIQRMRSAVAILLFCSVLAGCIPARFLENPGVSGKVVSADSGAPIADATVRLELKNTGHATGPAILSTVTDSSGAFEIAPRKKWGIMILAADYFPMTDHVEISADGYRPRRWTFTGLSPVARAAP